MRKTLARLETFELFAFGYSVAVAALILAALPRVPHAGTILALHAGITASVAALAWADVRPMVVRALQGLPELVVLLFEPAPREDVSRRRSR